MIRQSIIIFSLLVASGLVLSVGPKGFIDGAFAKQKTLGVVEFSNSCKPEAAETINSSVALLHHMMYAQAEQELLKVLEIDPDCAMAYWGIAMTQFHPLWAPPSKKELKKGHEAAMKANELKPGTPREQSYVDAVAAFYTDWDTTDHKSRIQAWSDGQKNVLDANPEDVNAGAFYSLSLLATAPKADKSFKNQKAAGALLEKLHKQYPEHPGLFHYTIHAYDNPVLAKRAVPVARDYDKIAPDVPHALHMPSHIFVRLGMWPETITWNIRSADSAKRQSTDTMSLHYIHAVDYLMYAYLQQGQYQKAVELLNKVNSIKDYQDSFASAYGIAAAQARYPLERAEWAEAASLGTRTHASFPWDKHPQYEAITYYAKGLGAARNGDVEGAKKNKAKLDELYQNTVDSGDKYWGVIVDAQRQTVDAWITYASGDKEQGLLMMSEAADLEDSMDKHPVTPGAVMPARDMYGDMLIMSDRPADALAAYEASLKISPNRYYALYGAGRAAEAAGDKEKAMVYYQQLIELTQNADSQTAAVEHAKKFSESN